MKTAIDWYEKEIFQLHIKLENKDISIGEYATTRVELFNQAKEKEKQQIVETFNKGTWNGGNNVNYENGHDFYNQTYNQ
jgi:hypothetical protein